MREIGYALVHCIAAIEGQEARLGDHVIGGNFQGGRMIAVSDFAIDEGDVKDVTGTVAHLLNLAC